MVWCNLNIKCAIIINKLDVILEYFGWNSIGGKLFKTTKSLLLKSLIKTISFTNSTYNTVENQKTNFARCLNGVLGSMILRSTNNKSCRIFLYWYVRRPIDRLDKPTWTQLHSDQINVNRFRGIILIYFLQLR